MPRVSGTLMLHENDGRVHNTNIILMHEINLVLKFTFRAIRMMSSAAEIVRLDM
jgi:hypothetical protein